MSHLRRALSAGNIFIAFKNSIIVTIGTIILSLIVSILGGYAFTFYKFKFKEYFYFSSFTNSNSWYFSNYSNIYIT